MRSAKISLWTCESLSQAAEQKRPDRVKAMAICEALRMWLLTATDECRLSW